MTRYLYRSDVRCRALRKAIGLSQPQAKSIGMGETPEPPLFGARSPLDTLMLFLEYSFWMGNDRSGVLKSIENLGLWNTIHAGVSLDPNGPDPQEVARQADQAISPPWVVFRRGRSAGATAPGFFYAFYCVDSQIYAHFAAARTALMLSAFRRETGRDASTLDEVAERFGWKIPCHPLTKIPVTYTRLVPPVNSEDGAFAYALACWADGRAVKPGGGTVWLVVRNPAFGELPFRIYTWISNGVITWRPDGSNSKVMTNAVAVGTAELPPEENGVRHLPVLSVDHRLFSADADARSEGEAAMLKFGWTR